ncbi:MAG: hypothetical protein VYB43_06540 [Pseudomonadota bacterium]|nr:hypothetical protein [Pseudomonadota bacterium]
MLSECKQVTVADVVSGWHFSGPLADQIRRKSGLPVAIAQSGQGVPAFGISNEPWVRLRWGERWARETIRGWSMAAIVKWFGSRQLQDKNPKDKSSVGTASWWTTHEP